MRPLLATIGFLIFALTIVALAGYVGLFVRSMLQNWTLEHLITLLFLWQTQTAAAFAIAAALLGSAVILHQTATARRQEEERRERRSMALWAMLPLDLMEMIDYATGCAKIHAGVLEQSGAAMHITQPGLQFPLLPEGLVGRLAELIEAARAGHANPLITLVRRLQIQHARARDIQRRAANQHGSILLRANVIGGLIDATEIYARCAKLLDYARGNRASPAAAVLPADVKATLFTMPTGLPDMDELYQEIERRSAAGESGHNWPET